MFDYLLLSKNQRLIKKWKKEHGKIILLTHKVIAEYSKNNHKKAKKELVSLNNLVIDHVIDEDIKFYTLLRNKDELTNKNKIYIEEFIDTFDDVKTTLMQFLTEYTRDEIVLDDNFFNTLNKLAKILIERINFEEENLYNILDISKEEEKWAKIKRAI